MFTNESENIEFFDVVFSKKETDQSMARDDQISECYAMQGTAAIRSIETFRNISSLDSSVTVSLRGYQAGLYVALGKKAITKTTFIKWKIRETDC